MDSLIEKVLNCITASPHGVTTLDMLESLKLCDESTLKTTLSRLNKSGKIFRLKRGVYSSNPITDAFAAAQATFNGYIGFTSALYLHKIITEVPFTITVVTVNKSSSKAFGTYEFKAISLKEKAFGFENFGDLTVSTKAKTLFDCLYLPKYSVEENKLVEAYDAAHLKKEDWREFDLYVEKFASSKLREKVKTIHGKIKKSD